MTLLEQVSNPESNGLGAARSSLRDLFDEGVGCLPSWERGVAELDSERHDVDHGEVRRVLGLSEDSESQELAYRVKVLSEALTLDLRAQVLTSAEAQFRNPGRTWGLQSHLAESLSRNAETRDRFADCSCGSQHRLSVGQPDWRSTSESITEPPTCLAALTAAATEPADHVPALLTSTGQQVLEIGRSNDGSVQPRLVAAS